MSKLLKISLFCLFILVIWISTTSCGSPCDSYFGINRTLPDTTVTQGASLSLSTKGIFSQTSDCDFNVDGNEVPVKEIEITNYDIVEVEILNDTTITLNGKQKGSSTVILYSSAAGFIDATHFEVTVE